MSQREQLKSSSTLSKKNRGTKLFTSSLSAVHPDFLQAVLAEYEYVSPNLSLFEILFLNNFWEMFVNVYPKWLAPNLITFLGFLTAEFAAVLLVIFSPHLKGESPRWLFLFAAICQFIYQTLDGSDGKQARRTKSGSPLGELFDHGVDALVTSVISMFAIELLSFGLGHFHVCLVVIGIYMAFFSSIFTALHTKKQRFGLFDCQEIQVVVETALVITSIAGPQIWFTKIFFPPSLMHLLPTFYYDWKTYGDDSIEFRYFIAIGATMGSFYSVLMAHAHVFKYYWDHRNEHIRREGRGIVSVLLQQFIMVVQCILAIVSWSTANDLSTKDSSVLFAWFLFYGFTWSDLVNHLLLTRVAQLPFPRIWMSRAIIGDVLFQALLLCGSSPWLIGGRWLLVFLMFLSNLNYCITMGNAICNALKLNWFTIDYKHE